MTGVGVGLGAELLYALEIGNGGGGLPETIEREALELHGLEIRGILRQGMLEGMARLHKFAGTVVRDAEIMLQILPIRV